MCDTTMEKKKSETSYLRKIKKPVIEKKRRDRINSCVNQLKSILLENIQLSGGTQVSKLDKADILEMTVSHLRQIQHQQLSVAMATSASVAGQFQEGFAECAKETVRYMDTTRVYPSDMSTRLERHLLCATGRTPHSDTSRQTSVGSPYDITDRHSAVRSLHFDVDSSSKPISIHSGQIYRHTPVKMVFPVKQEPVYDVIVREIPPCSPDSIQLGGEASNMNTAVSQTVNRNERDSSVSEAGSSKQSILAMPARIPVNVSPSQKTVWRPF